jgi:hypothetical protein
MYRGTLLEARINLPEFDVLNAVIRPVINLGFDALRSVRLPVVQSSDFSPALIRMVCSRVLINPLVIISKRPF